MFAHTCSALPHPRPAMFRSLIDPIGPAVPASRFSHIATVQDRG